MICPRCGNETSDSELKCENCGMIVGFFSLPDLPDELKKLKESSEKKESGFRQFLMIIVKIALFFLVIAAVIYAKNLIYVYAAGFGALVFFGIILLVAKEATSKKTTVLCFLICFCVCVTFLVLLLLKMPSISYNLSDPTSISCQEDIDYCLDKGVKKVSIVPKVVTSTQMVEKESVRLRRQKTRINDGRIRFYYSIVELDDVNILVKHSNENLRENKSIVVYLSTLDDEERILHDKYSVLNMHESILIYDEETFNSNMFGWYMWIVYQCIILLTSIGCCIYIFLRYKKQFLNV